MSVFGNKEGKNINPGIKELSRTTKICERAVKKALNILVKKEVITLSSIRKHGTRDKSCYEINISLLKEKILQKVGAPRAPRVGALCAPTSVTKDKKVGAPGSKVGAPRAPRVGAPRAPISNTQFLNHELPKERVKSGADFTLAPDDQKLEKKWGEKTREVFRHWQKVMNHPGAKLDHHRRGKIVRALILGFSVDQLKMAIDGIKKSPFHMGRNKSKQVHDKIDLIFRNSERIEEFISFFDNPPRDDYKDGATAQKSGFLEKSQNQLKVLDVIGEELRSRYSKKDSQKTNIEKEKVNELG
jgi:hypothetical protein